MVKLEQIESIQRKLTELLIIVELFVRSEFEIANSMRYQIDQSGKIEDTNKLTIVAFANGKTRTLKISGVEKQRLIRSLRALDYPKKTFIFKAFAGLVFLLLEDQKVEEIVIDREYPGHEAIIKGILIQLFAKFSKETPEIEFAEITLELFYK